MRDAETHFVTQYAPGSRARVALVNGRIVDVAHGRYHDAGTRIVLQGGTIASMPGLADATPDFTIDLHGRAVLPGLFNTHMHGPASMPTLVPGLRDFVRAKRYEQQQTEKNLAECLAHGITNVRHAGNVADLRANRSLRERISRGDLPGPRIWQAVVVGPTGSYLQEKLPAWLRAIGVAQVDPAKEHAGSVAFPLDATEGQVRAAVDIAIDERGADVVKIADEAQSPMTGRPVPAMTLEQLCALADQARRRRVPSTMHHTTLASLRRGIQAGVTSIAHLTTDAPLTQEDVEAFKASGCLNDPTVTAFYAMFSWKLAGDRSPDHPALDRLTAFRERTYAAIADEFYLPALRACVMNGYHRCASGKPKVMGIVDVSRLLAWTPKVATGFENLRLLYQAGVPITTGNDTLPPCTPATLALELLMLDHVLQGGPDGTPLSGAEAVRIATFNSARSMGLEAQFGAIERGKTADLVILDGDPLADFHAIGSRVAALFLDGKLAINNCGLRVEPG
jgi:imidazolonepropionase-like amidohydrolase